VNLTGAKVKAFSFEPLQALNSVGCVRLYHVRLTVISRCMQQFWAGEMKNRG